MQASSRIVVNTLAQYIRTIINMALSLYSSRLVLNIIGIDDFGIFSLVAGVVTMLSFLTSSLVGSTQRFLSVCQGKGNQAELQEVFSNSLILHIILGFFVAMVLEGLGPFLFDGLLRIPSDRIQIAQKLYQQVVWMVYVSFLASPFRALLVSRENIIYTSVIDVLDGILKVVLVMFLPMIRYDKLYAYGWIMFGIHSFNLLAFSYYCYSRYSECVLPKLSMFSWNFVKRLSEYTGWVVYSTVIIAIRNQGTALVINRFYSVAANAAYGIGNQIANMLAFVSTSFTNAISPQLMAAEGAGNRSKMWMLAELQSKFSFLLLAMFSVPTMFEMPRLLSLWLGQVPEYSVMFACMFLAMQTIDQLSSGVGLANRAIGTIGKYTFITFTPKLLVLPLGYLFLCWGKSLYYIVFVMIATEYICMLIRILMFVRKDEFNVVAYCKNVFLKPLFPLLTMIIVCLIIVDTLKMPYRFIVTYMISIPVFICFIYVFGLNKYEKKSITQLIQKFRK